MDNRTEQIADGVWRVEVAWYVNAYVLANDGHSDAEGLTLVDPGPARCAPSLVRSIRLAGLKPDSTTTVLLSHWHPRAAGGAARFAQSTAQPTVHAYGDDLAILQGRTPSPTRRHSPPPPVTDAEALHDGQQLDIAAGLHVIATPGHTLGHVAFHLPHRGVLLAGGAVRNVWRLSAGTRVLADHAEAIPTTLARLAELDHHVLAPAHGPPITDNAMRRLQRLAARLKR